MYAKLCICLILGLLTCFKSDRGYDAWSFYAGNNQVEIKMPTSYHCYYECKTEYMDYICMFKSDTISSKNILIAAYGGSTLDKFFPEADFCFSAIKVEKEALPMIDSISKTIEIRKLSRPINVFPILKSPPSAKDWETRRVLI